MFWKKQINIKNIIIYIIAILFILCGLVLLNKAFGQDLMEQAFKPAMSYDTVVNLWNTKNAVWNTILRESVSVEMNENMWRWCFVNDQYVNVDENKCTELGGDWNVRAIDISAKAPLIVRIAKFLLRMTIVLSITMVIFNAVKYMFEVLSGKDRNSTESKKNLVFVAVWVVVALMSVSIINLVISVPKSSIKTSDDLSSFEIWCKINSTIIAGDDLKKLICEEVLSWEWEPNETFTRCNVNWDDQSINQEKMEYSCINDLEWTVVK